MPTTEETEAKEQYDANMKGTAVLFAVTIALAFGKLIGAWPSLSWWWVTAPMWFPYAMMLALLLMFGLLLLMALIAGGFFGLLSVITTAFKKDD